MLPINISPFVPLWLSENNKKKNIEVFLSVLGFPRKFMCCLSLLSILIISGCNFFWAAYGLLIWHICCRDFQLVSPTSQWPLVRTLIIQLNHFTRWFYFIFLSSVGFEHKLFDWLFHLPLFLSIRLLLGHLRKRLWKSHKVSSKRHFLWKGSYFNWVNVKIFKITFC